MPATASVGSSNEAVFWARLGLFLAILEDENRGLFEAVLKYLKKETGPKGLFSP